MARHILFFSLLLEYERGSIPQLHDLHHLDDMSSLDLTYHVAGLAIGIKCILYLNYRIVEQNIKVLTYEI
jgi:hypothetical protein